ncbi:UNVERIFIED_CONTAM: hypothetical protein Slati_3163600 [Sesamum latifolium]|uniref:Reverse transcriptase zinc-binding domain-containing protein n=1 Tax=Sesamum latifolium TaxID=2727402 RepID=A0AAW2UWK1_9LAMI
MEEWKEELVRTVFSTEDDDVILSILVGGVDPLRWNYERHGHFTVRSAFQFVCREDPRRSVGQGETSSSDLASWSFIWSARVPPKVHLFTWRVCWNWLPMILNLEGRGKFQLAFVFGVETTMRISCISRSDVRFPVRFGPCHIFVGVSFPKRMEIRRRGSETCTDCWMRNDKGGDGEGDLL